MVNALLYGKTAPNESFTRKKIETPKAALGTPPGTGTHALRDWATRTEGGILDHDLL